MNITNVRFSTDGSIKYTLETSRRVVEALYFEYSGHFDGRAGKRATICLSVQSGCPLNCTFCSTASLEFKGSLSGREILAQAQAVQEHLVEIERPAADSYALMGMGEPMLNLKGSMEFYRLVQTEHPHIAPVSMSTVGIPARIRAMSAERDIDFKLFLSIHTPFQKQRDTIMPDLVKYPVRDAISAAAEYAESRERKVEASYLLLRGVNDSPEHIHATAALLDPDHFDAQLLLFNEGNGIAYSRPEDDVAERSADIFRQHGFLTTVQVSKGRDIAGGCGQLAEENLRGVKRIDVRQIQRSERVAPVVE